MSGRSIQKNLTFAALALIFSLGTLNQTRADNLPGIVAALVSASDEGIGARLNSWWEHKSFLKWADKEEGRLQRVRPNTATGSENLNEPDDIDVKPIRKALLTRSELSRIRDSSLSYFKAFGRDSISSFLWTGVESANPLTRNEEYRWDSLKEEGMYDHARRMQLASHLKSLGFRNIRLGMPNHNIDIENEESWKQTTEMIDDFAQAGMRISLDLHHFGIEDRFRQVTADGRTIGETSYYLNPAWPAYFAKFARKAVEKYHDKISAVTIMNEPETVVGFNGEMWHGGFPGWSSDMTNFWYIERCLQVAKATVMARLEIESYFSTMATTEQTPLVYIHTEASIIKPYWKQFNLYRRFIVSDLILGSDWVTTTDFQNVARKPMADVESELGTVLSKNKTAVGWLIENYAVRNQLQDKHDSLRQNLLQKLTDVQKLHLKLKQRFNKTMRTDTVFAIDYYAQNEDRDSSLNALRPEPQFYAGEIIEGRRTGLYRLMMDYFNHFKMPMMVGETGTPFYDYGSRWHKQMLLECSKAALAGVPLLGYTIYPAVDTWGWESALSLPREHAILNPAGIFDVNIQARPFITNSIESLQETMKR